MKKRSISIILMMSIIFTIVSFSGCKIIEQEEESIKKYKNFGCFSEGLAWVEYVDSDTNEYFGCINENGKMLFCYRSDDFDFNMLNSDYYDTKFENGYAFLEGRSEPSVYLIDKEGNICSKFDSFIAYGYGYVITEEHIIGFDSESYTYTIYDANKNVIATYENESRISASYCGEGVFRFGNKLFIGKTKEFVDYPYGWDYFDDNMVFNNGVAYVSQHETVVYSDGKKFDVDFPDELILFKRQNDPLYSGTIIYYDDDYNNTVASFNINTEEIYYLTDKTVLEHLDTHFDNNISSKDISPKCNENGLIFPLIGDDGYRYVVLTDYKLNIKTEPIKCFDYEACENGVFIIDSVAYDINGTELFSLEEKGYTKTLSSSEELMFVLGNKGSVDPGQDCYQDEEKFIHKFAVMDNKGNIIFDKIDTENVIEKSTN